jgi:hypothetical protein
MEPNLLPVVTAPGKALPHLYQRASTSAKSTARDSAPSVGGAETVACSIGIEFVNEHDMGADVGSEGTNFVVEEVNAGTHANGFGRTDDGRAFAFRVQRSTLYVKIYRADVVSAVPDRTEVDAVAEHSVTEIDLTDERSIIGVVRDAVAHAQQLSDVSLRDTAVRAFFNRVNSALEGF